MIPTYCMKEEIIFNFTKKLCKVHTLHEAPEVVVDISKQP